MFLLTLRLKEIPFRGHDAEHPHSAGEGIAHVSRGRRDGRSSGCAPRSASSGSGNMGSAHGRQRRQRGSRRRRLRRRDPRWRRWGQWAEPMFPEPDEADLPAPAQYLSSRRPLDTSATSSPAECGCSASWPRNGISFNRNVSRNMITASGIATRNTVCNEHGETCSRDHAVTHTGRPAPSRGWHPSVATLQVHGRTA